MRCFVALRPDEAALRTLLEVAKELSQTQTSARRLSPSDLHLTLAFIGELPDVQAQRLAAVLENTFGESLAWTIDRAGTFPRARVLWVGGAASPALGALANEVRSCLTRVGVTFDARPFVPHITLARAYRTGARLPYRLAEPIVCFFGPPQLMQSVKGATGERYRPVSSIAAAP